jgi:predicted phosphodiesterase
MRLGLISDIHGNLRALRAVLNEFEGMELDSVHCLGDMIGYLHQSSQVIDEIMNSKIQVIMGNHEATLLSMVSCTPERWKEYNMETVKEHLSETQKAWLSGLAVSRMMEIDDRRCAFFHGSPWNPLEEYIYPDSNRFDEFPAIGYRVVFLGHTHRQMLKHVGGVTILNPGSCGLPRDGSSGASAAVYDSLNGEATFIHAEYDVAATIEEAKRSKASMAAIEKLAKGCGR